MNFKQALGQLNVRGNCKKYGLGMWRCPQFLFLVMGLVIIVTAVVTYVLGTRYIADPSLVSLIVLGLTLILLILSFSITRSLEGLAEANRLKSEFISIVSHQLRSPLSNLKWALEILISGRFGKVEGKPADYLQILSDNAQRMGELVSSLLTVSRIDQGTLPLHKAEFSLSDLAKETIAEFLPAAAASHVEIILLNDVSEQSLPKAFGDVSQIKLVLENFISNAVRYTKGAGKVEVIIGPKNGGLMFSVKDGGVGIPKEDQKHIFQKFFRSDNVLKYQTEGSGLGLYIAKSIVEKSGGKIGFKSEEGKGSTFWFIVPKK